ncbi:MAG: hypothetical protein OQL05_01665 [Gammaproteobacteria bacterium]|nr:hypothetical protein [Gammaproteobacteria bacterium]MCW8971970.1 hypothetical protein [Gammaproteobacteria bacterium]MCW8991990.1 hypothetical protein [Gammaproteobacteria bacterium]
MKQHASSTRKRQMKSNHYWPALAALFFLLFTPFQFAAAACSSAVGKATINEVYDLGQASWVEVKLILPNTPYNNWDITLCVPKNNGGSDCASYDLSGITPSNDYYLTVPVDSKYVELNNGKQMDILLTDSAGKVVDYLSVNGYTEQQPACVGDLLYPTVANNTSSNLKGIYREPDGTGDWMELEGGGATGEPSTGDTNNDIDDPDAILVTPSDSQVQPGTNADFLLTLTDSDGNTISDLTENVTIEYMTFDGEGANGATSPEDYTWVSGTAVIPAGSGSTTVSVSTTANALIGEFFHLVIIDAYTASGTPVYPVPQYATATFANIISYPHHIQISHDGQGITCQAEPVTLTACANADCSQYFADDVLVDLTSPTDGWSADPMTISGGSTTINLTHTTAETVTLAATASSPPASNATECVNSGSGNACEILFSDVGLVIDGDDSDSNLESPVPLQLAGKSSATGFNGATQRVRLLRTDNDTGACIGGALVDSDIEASFHYTRGSATSGLSDNTFTIQASTTTDLTQADTAGSVQLEFDANSTAPFTFRSLDAGEYSLTVSVDVPVLLPNGNPHPNKTVTLSDSTIPFVVRPLAVLADSSGNAKAQDHNGGVFTTAGNNFDVGFKALRWAAGRDTNNDGELDNCTIYNLADPGSDYAKVPAWNIVQPATELILPSPGTHPDIDYVGVDTVFSAGSNTATATVSYAEVGIIQFDPDGLPPFLGTDVKLCSPHVGRFIPADFLVDHNHNAQCNGFTYAGLSTSSRPGEPFSVSGSITARNSNGDTTENYEGDFAKLQPADITATARDGAAAASGTLNFAVDSINFTDGVGSLQENDASYDFAAIGGPETLHLALDAEDSDTVSGAEEDASKTVEYRFGRLFLHNAYGPQTSDLNLPVVVEYHDGTAFVENGDDSCTVLPLPSAASLDGWTNNLESGETTVTATSANLGSGVGYITLGAPGLGDDGNDGSVDITLDMSGIAWLRPDSDGDGVYENNGDDDAIGTATFGMYRGDDRFYFWQEAQ